MKNLVLALGLAISLSAVADVVLDKASDITTVITRPVMSTVSQTNTVSVPVGAKVVWTQFSISYEAPAFTQAVYTVVYMIQDPTTEREIPRSRTVKRMTEKEVSAFALTKGVDFTQMGQGVGYLLNEYLKTQVK